MLLKKLKDYSASGALPMHMPGHKRNVEAFPWLLGIGGGLDITEINGFDNLNDPQGLFRELEDRVARLWGARESICLVNGSTSGVLSAVRAVMERGGELLMVRGSHKSVYHAAEICAAEVHYIVPRVDRELGIWCSVTAEDVAKALDEHPNIRLVAITSPTYEGVISDIRSIAEVCHKRGVPLFVDEAHGAHLGFGSFPESAVKCGADIVVQSLHKTLPCLTQTAVLHVCGELVDPSDVRRNAAMFQSSSPSYLLSASIDACVGYLEHEGNDAAERWLAALRGFGEKVRGLENLRIWSGGDGVFARDPSKIVISTVGTDMDGAALMRLLRERFSIELEMAYGSYALAMTGMGDTEASLSRLADAVISADKMCRKACKQTTVRGFRLPEKRMPAHEAVSARGEFVDIKRAMGRISGEYVWAYPPGVPIIVSGEVIGENVIKTVLTDKSLHSTRGQLPDRIFCV